MVDTEPVGSEHAESLAALLALASRGCFCRWWHYEGDDLSWQARCNLAPEENRAELVAAVSKGHEQGSGIVALEEGVVVGWLKLCPASHMTKLSGRRLYRDMAGLRGEREGVLVIACVTVHPQKRRRGIADALIGAAIEQARITGASALEALPRRHGASVVRDDELWMGPVAAFERHGFTVVEGPEAYPLMRRSL